MDLFGLSRVASLGGKHYAFVIVDDFSRLTWILFIAHKNDVLNVLTIFCKKVQNEKGYTITSIRSDHGGEFENVEMEAFCNKNGFDHNFSAPRTPQQNGVVERKNRTLQEMARSTLNENGLPKYFWAEAVSTACYIVNRVMIRSILNKTPYELWKGRKPNIGYLKVFGCKCFILNTKDNLGKFDSKSNVGIFLGYSTTSKAYRVFNKRTLVVEESMHVIFDESNTLCEERKLDDDDIVVLEPSPNEQIANEIASDEGIQLQQQDLEEVNESENGNILTLPQDLKFKYAHPKDQILGDPLQGVKTRASLRNICNGFFISN